MHKSDVVVGLRAREMCSVLQKRVAELEDKNLRLRRKLNAVNKWEDSKYRTEGGESSVYVEPVITEARTVEINGVTYEQAVEAGSARRKAFALRHLVRFGICTAIYLLFAVVGQIIGWPFWIDIIVFTVGVIGAAISTIGITL